MDANRARKLLEAERWRLLEAQRALQDENLDAEAEEESWGELSPIDHHQADVGSEVFEREKDLSLLARVNGDLREVEAALCRLDHGLYGSCETCGAVIPDERLEAVPAARLCVKHEWLWEVEGATFLPRSNDSRADATSAEEVAAREARRNLDFLPTEDELAEVVELSPEEFALHLNRPAADAKARPAAAELEQAEANEAGELADESMAARRAEAEARRAAEEVANEEQELGDTASSSPLIRH